MTEPSSPAISKRNSAKTSRRFARPNTTVGVEIGHNTIYMVQLKMLADGEVFFEKCRAFEFDPNLTPGTSAFSSILKAALKEFCGSLKEFAIWAAPKLDRARLHHLKIPRVSPAQLSGAVFWKLQREDSFLENETVVDFQIEEGEESDAILNITGALVDRECVEDIQKAFSEAGYPLTGIGLPLLALRNLVKLRGEGGGTAPKLLCQMGQLSTSVSVLLEGRLVFTRNIPLGLESLAESIVKEPDSTLNQKEACNIILNLGRDEAPFTPDERGEHEKAFTLLRPVLERTVRQIERTIEYYQSNFDTEPMETIFLGGEIGARGKLFDFISEKLLPKVVALDPFDTPELQAKSSLPGDKVDRIAFGPAFGLALEGSQIGINLAHTYKDRQNEGRQNKLAMVASVLLILLALLAALFYNTQRLELRGLVADREELEESLNDLGPRLTEAIITEANEEVRLLEEQRRAATNRYEGLALLSEITRLTPENISLLHISAAMGSTITFLDSSAKSAKSGSDKTVADRKGTLLLKGVVTGVRTSLETSLTIYIARLDQSHLFNKVEVASTEVVQSSGELHLIFTLNVETIAEIEVITKK
ncbi:MAG: pilus assembly protein PilM [Verrucomicrobiaceae bacterium]